MKKLFSIKNYIRFKSTLEVNKPLEKYNNQISFYLELKKQNFAKDVFQEILKNKLKPNDQTIILFLNFYLETKNYQNAEHFLHKIKNLNLPINEEEKLILFFDEFIKVKGTVESLKKIDEFESKSYQIPIQIYVLILNQFFKENKLKKQ